MAVDVDEIQTTKGEKLLALVLAACLLLGAIWAYDQLGPDDRYRPQSLTPEEQKVVSAHERARNQLTLARGAVTRERRELEFAREDYRTALDAGRPSAALERAYRREQREYRAAQAARDRAAERERATRGPSDRAYRQSYDRADERRRGDEWLAFGLRLAFVLAFLAASLWAFLRLRGSHYQALAAAAVLAAAGLMFGMGIDYVSDYVAWRDVGTLALSLVGAGLTLLAFWGLQRYLARRIPIRRVRKGECPFCGYPARGEHCEGCGREIVAPCTSCEAPRRVGAPHCAVCGKA